MPYGGANSGNAAAPQTTMNPPITPVAIVPNVANNHSYSATAMSAAHRIPPPPAQALASTDTRNTVVNRVVNYTVRPGDTLGKIAWHFYHDSGPLALRRIVSANRSKLAGANAVIYVGEPLIIPAENQQASSGRPQLLAMAAQTTGNIHADSGNPQSSPMAASPQTSTRTYRVRSGDTLLGIARKLMGAGTESNVHRIMALNHIRDPRTIFVGQKLQIPG